MATDSSWLDQPVSTIKNDQIIQPVSKGSSWLDQPISVGQQEGSMPQGEYQPLIPRFINQLANAGLGALDAAVSTGGQIATFPASLAMGAAAHLSGRGKEVADKWAAYPTQNFQPGVLTNTIRGLAGLEQIPPEQTMAAKYLEPVGKAFETLIPSQQIEQNIGRVKELGVNPKVADAIGFGTAKFIELMAFHGYHQIAKGAIGQIKGKLKEYEKAKTPEAKDAAAQELGSLQLDTLNKIAEKGGDVSELQKYVPTPIEGEIAARSAENATRTNAESQQFMQSRGELVKQIQQQPDAPVLPGVVPETGEPTVSPVADLPPLPPVENVAPKLEEMRNAAKAELDRINNAPLAGSEVPLRQQAETQRTNTVAQEAVARQRGLQSQLEKVAAEANPAKQKIEEMKQRILEAQKAREVKQDELQWETKAEVSPPEPVIGEPDSVQKMNIVPEPEPVKVQEFPDYKSAKESYDLDKRKFKSLEEAQQYINDVPDHVKEQFQLDAIKVGDKYRVGSKIQDVVDENVKQFAESVRELDQIDAGIDVPRPKVEKLLSAEEIQQQVINMIPEIELALAGQNIEATHSKLRAIGDQALASVELELSDKIDQTLTKIWRKKLEQDALELKQFEDAHQQDMAGNLTSGGAEIKVDASGYNGVSIGDLKNVISAIKKVGDIGEVGAVGDIGSRPKLGDRVKNLSQQEIDSLRNVAEVAKKAGKDLMEFLKSSGMTEVNAQKIKEMIDDLGENVKLAKENLVPKESDVVVAENVMNQVIESDSVKRFFDEQRKKGEMVDTYRDERHYERQKAGISTDRKPELTGKTFGSDWISPNSRAYGALKNLVSPHNAMWGLFKVGDNPVTDVFKSALAYARNVSNGKKWARDVLKDIPKMAPESAKLLEPFFAKFQERFDTRAELGRVDHSLKAQIKNLAGNKRDLLTNRYYANLSKIKRLTKKGLAEEVEKIRSKNSVLQEKINSLPLSEKGKKIAEWRENKAKFSDVKQLTDDMISEWDKIIPELAAKESSVRVTLKAGDLLPEGIQLSDVELNAAARIREYFDKTREEMNSQGMPVEQGAYLPRLFKPILDAQTLNSGFISRVAKTPAMLKMIRQMPDGRPWLPDAHQILESYIPIIERELAYNPFLARWKTFIDAKSEPKLRQYMQNWVNENLYRKPENFLSNINSAATALEFARIIGLSIPVAFKHLTKIGGTLAQYDSGVIAKALGKTLKVAGQSVKEKLGGKVEGKELEVFRSYVTARQLVKSLDESPLNKVLDTTKEILGSPVMAIEAFDNGLSVFAAIMKGAKEGKSVGMTERGMIKTILDVNFRGGWDQPLWMKGTLARWATMFQVTPFKATEMKYQMIRRAMANEKDAFGTHYGKTLLKYVMMVGTAETIARANDTSILDMMLHVPFTQGMIAATKKGYKVHVPSLATSPFVQLATEMTHNKEGAIGGFKKHYGLDDNFMPTVKSSPSLARYQRALKGKHDRFESVGKMMLGLKPVERH